MGPHLCRTSCFSASLQEIWNFESPWMQVVDYSWYQLHQNFLWVICPFQVVDVKEVVHIKDLHMLNTLNLANNPVEVSKHFCLKNSFISEAKYVMYISRLQNLYYWKTGGSGGLFLPLLGWGWCSLHFIVSVFALFLTPLYKLFCANPWISAVFNGTVDFSLVLNISFHGICGLVGWSYLHTLGTKRKLSTRASRQH